MFIYDIQGLSDADQMLSSSPKSPEARKSPHSLHGLGTLLLAASAAKRREPISETGAPQFIVRESANSLSASDSTSYGNQSHDDLLCMIFSSKVRLLHAKPK